MHDLPVRNRKHHGTIRTLAFLGLAITIGLSLHPWSSLAHAADGHPARIHEGTCQSLGPVDYSLTGLGASVDVNGNAIATPQAVNPDQAYQVMTSESTIDTTVANLLASDQAIMVYDNDEDMQAIACGNIGGAMLEGTLVVGIGEDGITGHVGFALFQPHGDKTDVTILVGHAMSPVSAGGALPAVSVTGEDMTHQHESEEGHDDMATPEA